MRLISMGTVLFIVFLIALLGVGLSLFNTKQIRDLPVLVVTVTPIIYPTIVPTVEPTITASPTAILKLPVKKVVPSL